tara:strand:- start:1159 stop:1338 length:180 start_codon:yes stop_codon:yes gene_type:complete
MSKRAQDFLAKKKEAVKGKVREKTNKGPDKDRQATKQTDKDRSKMPEALRKHLEKKGKR